ncbi:MAG TPA: nuclear transport factor 2 family protein [Caulobacteraceae bacterium]
MATPQENRDLVLASYDAFRRQDRDKLASLFAPDAQWLTPPRNRTSVALGQPPHFIGREAILTYLMESVSGGLFTGAKVEVLSVIADERHVVIEQTFEATVCNGRPFEMVYCFIYTLEDGLIRQVRAYFDTVSGAEQLFGDEPPRKLV